MKSDYLNIFHVSGYPYHAGGIDTWLHNFIMNNTDLKIKLFCPTPIHDFKSFEINRFKNLDIYYTGVLNGYRSIIKWGLLSVFKIKGKIFVDAPCLVLSTIPTLIPVFILKKFGIIKTRVICSVRGCLAQDAIDTGKNRFFIITLKFIEKILLNICDEITANGWDTAEYLKVFYGIESKVLPNGIAEKRMGKKEPDEDLLELRKLKEHRKVVMHIGTLREIKGIDYILEACTKISEDREDFVLVFVGKGKIEEYKRKAESLGLYAVFTGTKNNVDDYLELADVVVNVSGGGGVSNSLLESMNNGKIVVAWDKKTFSQVIRHGENGLLAEYRNISDLADKIRQGVDNIYGIKSVSVKNSIEKFRWKNLNEEWKDILGLN